MILVIKQIGLSLLGRPILLLTRMITDRIGLHSVLLPLLRIVLEAVPLASLLYCLIVGAHTLLESQFQGVTIVSKL